MADETLLVTGATGFTGRHLIQAARKKGYRCVAIAQEAGEVIQNADDTIIADLIDPAALELAIQKSQPDYIVHLAAISFVAHGNASEIYQVNQLGTINLLETIRSHTNSLKKVLIASSANIYGNSLELPITEATPPAPINHYGMSKYAMEMAARLYQTCL